MAELGQWADLIADARPLTRADLGKLQEAYGFRFTIPAGPVFRLNLYEAAGPVCSAYIRSNGPADAITGPAGSGKTVGSIVKAIRFAMLSMPICRDGRIRCKVTVLRQNYRALYRTTLKSWFEWFPPDYPQSTFSGGVDRPAVHKLKLSTVRDGREVPVDLDVEFFAVGETAIEELLKGYETSYFWINEADQLAVRAISFAYSRTGRYPSRGDLAEGVERPRAMGLDFNPMAPDHPLWKACEAGSFQEEPDPDALRFINFFRQPSGLSPQAENRKGKTRAEYEQDVVSFSDPADVERLVHGRPGLARIGRPVYVKHYDAAKHLARETLPVLPGPLHLGFDQGLRAACVIFQESSLGQIRFLDEVTTPEDGSGVGVTRFAEWLIQKLLSPRFRDHPLGIAGADPAGFTGADTLAGELTWALMMASQLQHMLQPAPSNEPSIRIEAITQLLRLDIEKGVPGLIVDPACKTLIKGFEALYVYGKRSDGTYEDRPIKNHAANVHDAAQYGVLTLRGKAAVITASSGAFGARMADRGGAGLPKPMDIRGFRIGG